MKRTVNALPVLAAYTLECASLAMADKTPAGPLLGDFSDYVATEDVVAEGTLVSRREVDRHLAGGCGASVSRFPIRSIECVVRIDEVVIGSMLDSLIAFVLPESEGSGSADVITTARPGQRVFVHAKRWCEDGWQLWGSALPLDSQGMLSFTLHHTGPFYLEGHPGVPYNALRHSLARTKLRSPLLAFERSRAIALLRIDSVLADGVIKLTCDSLGWIAGILPLAPQEIIFSGMPWFGFPGACKGDTIVMPLRATSRTIHLRQYPRGLLVEHGFVPLLGTTLAGMRAALKETDHGFSVRQFRTD